MRAVDTMKWKSKTSTRSHSNDKTCAFTLLCVLFYVSICIQIAHIINVIVQKEPRTDTADTGNFQGSVGLIRLVLLQHQSPYYILRDLIYRWTMARPYLAVEFWLQNSAASSSELGQWLPASLCFAPCSQHRAIRENQMFSNQPDTSS